MSETQQMALVHIQLGHLLEQLVQRLVAVRHHQGALPREVVVQVGYYLDGHVRFTFDR